MGLPVPSGQFCLGIQKTVTEDSMFELSPHRGLACSRERTGEISSQGTTSNKHPGQSASQGPFCHLYPPLTTSSAHVQFLHSKNICLGQNRFPVQQIPQRIGNSPRNAPSSPRNQPLTPGSAPQLCSSALLLGTRDPTSAW